MPKRKINNFNHSKRTRSSNTSTTDLVCDKDITDVTNIFLQANDEDFLDNTHIIMNKKRKHVKDFYNRTKEAPDTFDGENNMFDDLTENSVIQQTKKNVSISIDPCQTDQSDLTVEDDFSSTNRTLATTRNSQLFSSSSTSNNNNNKVSRDPQLFPSSSANSNNKISRDINESLINESYGSDSYSFGGRSGSFVIDAQQNHISNNRLSLTEELSDENENQVLINNKVSRDSQLLSSSSTNNNNKLSRNSQLLSSSSTSNNNNKLSRDPQLSTSSSANNNNKVSRDINESLINESYGSDSYSFGGRSGSLVIDTQQNHISNNRLSLTEELSDENENQVLINNKVSRDSQLLSSSSTNNNNKLSRNSQLLSSSSTSNNNNKLSRDPQLFTSSSSINNKNVGKKKSAYISKSSITFNTPCVTNNRIDTVSSNYKNSFHIDRSIIRLPDVTSEARANRPSTNNVVQMRTADIQSSLEYRELAKKNKDLSTKVNNLKQALKNMKKEKKKFQETHILKPRSSFWHELNVFMGSHDDVYNGDGRTIENIGDALGLSSIMIHQVQQDTDKPDKVAMNIWRTICPTREDRMYVGSIKRVPQSTLENIYVFARLCHPQSSFDYKKMKNDIATNIRQSNFYSKSQENMLNHNETQDNQSDDDANDIADDDNDIADDDNDIADDESQLFLKDKNLIDCISSDEE